MPVWPLAEFWPLLINADGTFRSIIIDYLYVELLVGKDVFKHGANKMSLFGSENFNTAVAFLLLNGANQLERN